MDHAVSTPTIPNSPCACCGLRAAIHDFDRRLDRVTDTMTDLGARVDSLAREMTAMFREVSEQNRTLLELISRAAESFEGLQRAILGK